jgi:hypothetical protein
VVLLRAKRLKPLVLIAVLASPSIVVFVAAQAREQVLPAANLLPAITAMCFLMALGLSAVLKAAAQRISEGSRPGTSGLGAVGVLLCIGLGWKSTYVQIDRVMELGPAHAQAHRWLTEHTPASAPIAVSFRTGGIPLLAQRSREPLPASWEVQTWLNRSNRPTHFVVSSIDSPSTHATLQQLQETAAPIAEARFEDETSVIWIYSFSVD